MAALSPWRLFQKKPPAKAVHGITDQLLSLAVPVELLEPDPANARAHDERNLAAIEASYRAHGQRKPLVVQYVAPEKRGRKTTRERYVVRAGNGQLAAVARLGWTHVAVVIVAEADAEAVAFALRDNRTAELAAWNAPMLAEQFHLLEGFGVQLEGLGFEPFEYEPLMRGQGEEDGGEDEDEGVVLPEKRIALMFTRAQWSALKDALSAKPSAELVLARLEGREE